MKVSEFKYEMRTTSAVLGRDHGIKVVFEGEQACTDGSRIILPTLDDNATLTNEQVKIMRGYVDHEAGHIRHSDMPLIMDKYERWMNSGKATLKDIHNCLEDVWMEQKVRDEYPGATKNMQAYRNKDNVSVLEQWDGLDADKQEEILKEMSEFNANSITRSIVSVGCKDYAGAKNREVLERTIPENMQKHAENWCRLARECKNSGEVIELAKSVYKLIEEDPQAQSNPEDFDPQSGEDIEDGDLPEKGKPQPQEGEGEPMESDILSTGDIKDIVDKITKEVMQPAKGTNTGDYVGPYTILTDEFDVVYSTKEPGNVRAFTVGDVNTYEEVKASIRSNVSTMKAKLRRALLARQRRDWDFGRETGRLDSKRLVAGYNNSPTVYKERKDRLEEDTAVLVLVDQSGSMSGRKIRTAQQCAIAISECFEGTSISYQVMGFDAHYHSGERKGRGKYARKDANRMYLYKPFTQSLRKSRGAIGYMHETGMHNNADRDAVVYALNELRSRSEKRKVLFVLSDGHPCHESDCNTKELMRHCKKAVEDGERIGIESVGIGIQDSSVEEIYKNNVVVQSVDELSGVVFNKLTTLLLGRQ